MSEMTQVAPMLRASNIDATIQFYRDTLGFELDGVAPERNWCCLKSGQVRLMFFSDADSDEHPSMTGVLYIYVDDVLTLHERISSQVKIEWGPEVFEYGMHEFAIKDCNGYTLSFGQPTDAEPTCFG